ncbi:cysteine hydrolase family protein [Trinickia dinghuensis]|uniref:Cysteine hydrolase n=1 Tax=Trinickia dinghuensis TaxID=2291023 RepID=A0A3D8K707_9BURK|nr:isochorismatase family cysteine hydrolase [Trinickia dinghuensis]RDV00677.1 cysteine hydrolase [Trinickia dinghuensis]
MSLPLSIDPHTSALLLMDFQSFVLDNFLPPTAASEVVSNASKLLGAARKVDMLTIHVTVGFRPGYPEISPRNKLFSGLKKNGMAALGSESTKIDSRLSPLNSEPVVVKHRIGAFSCTDLERLLRARGIDTLILAGVTTAGVVLSTVRQAFDLDYALVVASDGCMDPDEQAHAFVIERVLPQHANVLSADGIVSAVRP